MKRLMALLLCLMLSVMLLASCGGGEKTPEQLIEDAFDATDKVDCIEYTMDLTITYDMGEGQSMSMPMTVLTKITDLKSESPKIYMEVAMTEEDGDTETGTLYLEGDWMYITSEYGDETTSYKVPAEYSAEFGLDSYMADFDTLFADFPSDLFDGVTATSNDDGSKTVALSLTAEQMQTVFAELAAALTEGEFGEMDEGVSLSFEPASIEISVKNGLVSNYKFDLALSMTMDMDGDPATTGDVMTVGMSFAYDIDITKTSGVTITPPEGYLDFEDASQLLD